MNLTTKAMLIQLSISQWTARKHDRTASAEVAASHGANGSADQIGRFHKYLIDKVAIKPIAAAVNAARKDHEFLTLPWSDDGYRILSSEGYFSYTEKMRAHKDAFEKATSEFVAGFDAHLAEAENRLNSLFNRADYPSTEKLRGKFSFGYQVMPLPDAEDFRVTELGQSEVDAIKSEMAERMKREMAEATADPWRRIYAAVSHLSERLKAYDGSKAGSFRDTLISNLSDLVDVLPSLNITGDGELAAMTARLQSDLGSFTAAELRDSDGLREQAAENADSILEAMAGYVGGQ